MTLSTLLLALANHLWQSTVFALFAGLLVLAFRGNSARTRYGIWWVASAKFLVPFSVLVAVGTQFSWRPAPVVAERPSVSIVYFQQAAQPFTANEPVSSIAGAPAVRRVAIWPAIAIAAWLTGFTLLLARWCSRCRRARSFVAKSAGPRSEESRELATLRRLERRMGARKGLETAVSATAVEPSVFGFFRPVLVWPTGLSGKLSDAELEAILLHELSHARRRDNLTAALHTAVEAAFWFHPLVWWLGARLVDEREKACDQHALRWGGDPQVYAEGILEVCEFCLQSPWVCAAGVTGSDLKKRIAAILNNNAMRRMSFSRALLLAGAAVLTAVGPIAIGAVTGEIVEPQANATFEVVSIRPNAEATAGGGRGGRGARGGGGGGPAGPCGGVVELTPGRVAMSNVSLYRLITLAYDRHCRLFNEQGLIAGLPDWAMSAGFDIQATLPAGFHTDKQGQIGDVWPMVTVSEAPQLQVLIRNLLSDRFNLEIHSDTKEVPAYNLVLAKTENIRLSADQTPAPPISLPGEVTADGPPRGSFLIAINATEGIVMLHARGIPLSRFITVLQGGLGRMLVDKSGLDGLIDIPEKDFNVGPFAVGPYAVSVWPEVLRQLGFNLQAAREPVEMLVVDRVQRPSEN